MSSSANAHIHKLIRVPYRFLRDAKMFSDLVLAKVRVVKVIGID